MSLDLEQRREMEQIAREQANRVSSYLVFYVVIIAMAGILTWRYFDKKLTAIEEQLRQRPPALQTQTK